MVSNYEALAQYFGASKNPGPGAADIAKYILLNAQTSKPKGPGAIVPAKPSLMSRIFDVLSRPNYGMANLINEGQKTGDYNLKNFMEGLTAEKRTTFSKVLQDAGMENPTARSVLGFALDVGLDPTTYIPVAGIASKIKGAAGIGKSSSAVDEALEKPLGQRLLDQGSPIHPESFGLPEKAAQTVPEALAGPGKPQLPANQDLLDRRDMLHQEYEDLHSTLRGRISDESYMQDVLRISKELEDINKALKASGGKDPSKMLSDLAPQTGKVKPESAPVGQLQLQLDDITPVATKTVKEPAEKVVGEVPGQIPLKFPDLNIKKARAETKELSQFANELGERAGTIVSKIAAGDVKAAAKVLPTPPPKVTPKLQALANEILSRFNPRLSTAQLNKQYPNTINAKQQARLWHQAKSAAGKTVYRKGRSKESIAKSIDQAAIPIYKAVEDALVGKGRVLRLGTGENVKLSDVIAQLIAMGKPITDDMVREFSSNINPGSDVWKAVEALRARGAIVDSKTVKLVTEAVSESKATVKASGALSDAQTKNFDDFLKTFTKNVTKAADTSPAADKAAQALVNNILNTGKSAAQIAVEQSSRMLDEVVATGRANTQTNKVLTHGLEKDLGKLPKWAVHDNKAAEFLMGRVATWWGQADLRPMSLNAIGSSAATAAARGQYLDRLMTPFTQAQRHQAFKLAQGKAVTSGSPEVVELSRQIVKLMDNLTNNATGASVLLRSGVNMHMLNKWMRRYQVGFEFSNSKKAKDFTGKPVDYSKGTEWTQSWKNADIKDDPKAFLFKIQQAMEQATREKALFDELGERFGSTVPGKGHVHQLKRQGADRLKEFPYLEGYYFTKDIADQIPRMVRDWNVNSWSPNNAMMKHYDRVLSMWKSGVTIYRPGHHIRNIAGDLWLGWMDGVNSLKPYSLAIKVQKSMQGAYKDLMDIDRLIEVGAMPRTLGTPKPNQVLFKNRSGVPFTAEQIGAVAHQKGLLEHTRTIEDIIDMGEQGNKALNFKPFGGKVQAAARGMSELTSHNARLAHFIDKVMKSRGGNIEEIFEGAARRSRKWHPTGLDLTEFERKTMRRIMPFYTWMRKSLPLLLEGLVMNPGKAVIPAKAFDAIQESQGIETPNGRYDPFPVDQMFPEWLRAEGVGPVSMPDGFLSSVTNQTPEGYAMAGMGLNPLSSLIGQLQSPGKTVLSSITPAIKIPMEVLTGRESFTGEPISGIDARPGAFQEYVGQQIPGFNAIQGVTGITPFGTETKRSVSSNEAGLEALVNWFTAGGVKGTGPYVKQARFEQTRPLELQRKADKEEFLAYLRERMENGNP